MERMARMEREAQTLAQLEDPVLRLTRGLRGATDHVVISRRTIEGKAVRAAVWEPVRVDGRPVSDHHGIVVAAT